MDFRIQIEGQAVGLTASSVARQVRSSFYGAQALRQQRGRNEVKVLVRLPEINLIDDKAGKPIGINQHIGRRPLTAFGNSDGDLQMLQWTAAGSGDRFCLYVHHTDADREWAYDRNSSIGRLDQGLDSLVDLCGFDRIGSQNVSP